MRLKRTRGVLINIIVQLIAKVLFMLFTFGTQTIYVKYLGLEYVGLIGLFNNVLGILSFAELGFGTAMSFALYEPIASDNDEKVVELLRYFRKIYIRIILVILFVGLCVIPAIPYLIKGINAIPISRIQVYFVFFLINSALSYLVVYKVNYITAIQKDYIATFFDIFYRTSVFVAVIAIVCLTKNFLLFLIIQTILLLCYKIFLSFYLNKKCPILRKKVKSELSKQEKNNVLMNVKGLFITRLAGVTIQSTDNIIISSLISTIIVGLVSNYLLITAAFIDFVVIIFRTFVAPLGNIYVTESKEEFYKWYKKIDFLNFWIVSFGTSTIFVMLPYFIDLWIGVGHRIEIESFILLMISIFMIGRIDNYFIIRNVAGNYNIDKWYSVMEAILNIVISVPCAMYFGLKGVYIGTIVSRLFTLIIKPIKTYKKLYGHSYWEYVFKTVCQIIITLLVAFVAYIIVTPLLEKGEWGWFILSGFLVVLITNVLLFVCTFMTNDFKETFKYVREKIKNLVQKKKVIR